MIAKIPPITPNSMIKSEKRMYPPIIAPMSIAMLCIDLASNQGSRVHRTRLP